MRKLLFILFCWTYPSIAYAQYIGSVAGSGVEGYGGDNGWAPLSKFVNPGHIAFDTMGNMFVLDTDDKRIRKVNTAGIITTFVGNGVYGYTPDGSSVSAAPLNRAASLAMDNAGNIYITEFIGNRMRKISPSGIITTVAGTGTAGYNGDNIAALSAKLNYPVLGAIDHSGNIYFSDHGSNRVRKISAAGIITTIAGNGTPGYGGDGGLATACQLHEPTYTALGPDGNIYIPDRHNARIRKVDLVTGIITTFAGNGTHGNAGDNGPATAAELMSVEHIAFDNAGNAYIADFGASVIRKVNAAGIITTYAGTGIAGDSGDGGLASAAMLHGPAYLAYHTDGCLYVCDNLNNRVRKICITPIAVEEVQQEQAGVSLYPSPVQNELTVKSGVTIQNIKVVSLLGATVAVATPAHNAHAATLPLAALPPGIYCVLVNGVYAGRFVKE